MAQWAAGEGAPLLHGNPPEGGEFEHFLESSQILLTKSDKTKGVYCTNCRRWCDRLEDATPVCLAAKKGHRHRMMQSWNIDPQSKIAWAVGGFKFKAPGEAPDAVNQFGVICQQHLQGDQIFRDVSGCMTAATQPAQVANAGSAWVPGPPGIAAGPSDAPWQLLEPSPMQRIDALEIQNQQLRERIRVIEDMLKIYPQLRDR